MTATSERGSLPNTLALNSFIPLPLTIISIDGTEADDVIAYISKQLLTTQKIIITSTDKDFYQLIDDLLNSRVMLNPGHKGEVFCLAAEEAKELCLPIVTLGYGSLNERVEHGITGFIAKNFKEFINYSTEILNDKKTYFELRNNLINLRGARTYKDVAMDFIKILDLND